MSDFEAEEFVVIKAGPSLPLRKNTPNPLKAHPQHYSTRKVFAPGTFYQRINPTPNYIHSRTRSDAEPQEIYGISTTPCQIFEVSPKSTGQCADFHNHFRIAQKLESTIDHQCDNDYTIDLNTGSAEPQAIFSVSRSIPLVPNRNPIFINNANGNVKESQVVEHKLRVDSRNRNDRSLCVQNNSCSDNISPTCESPSNKEDGVKLSMKSHENASNEKTELTKKSSTEDADNPPVPIFLDNETQTSLSCPVPLNYELENEANCSNIPEKDVDESSTKALSTPRASRKSRIPRAISPSRKSPSVESLENQKILKSEVNVAKVSHSSKHGFFLPPTLEKNKLKTFHQSAPKLNSLGNDDKKINLIQKSPRACSSASLSQPTSRSSSFTFSPQTSWNGPKPVQSKVKQYVEQVKKIDELNRAECKMQKTLSLEQLYEVDKDIVVEPNDDPKASLAKMEEKLKETLTVIKEKDEIIKKLRESCHELQLKCADAENRIDEMRFGLIPKSKSDIGLCRRSNQRMTTRDQGTETVIRLGVKQSSEGTVTETDWESNCDLVLQEKCSNWLEKVQNWRTEQAAAKEKLEIRDKDDIDSGFRGSAEIDIKSAKSKTKKKCKQHEERCSSRTFSKSPTPEDLELKSSSVTKPCFGGVQIEVESMGEPQSLFFDTDDPSVATILCPPDSQLIKNNHLGGASVSHSKCNSSLHGHSLSENLSLNRMQDEIPSLDKPHCDTNSHPSVMEMKAQFEYKPTTTPWHPECHLKTPSDLFESNQEGNSKPGSFSVFQTLSPGRYRRPQSDLEFKGMPSTSSEMSRRHSLEGRHGRQYMEFGAPHMSSKELEVDKVLKSMETRFKILHPLLDNTIGLAYRTKEMSEELNSSASVSNMNTKRLLLKKK